MIAPPHKHLTRRERPRTADGSQRMICIVVPEGKEHSDSGGVEPPISSKVDSDDASTRARLINVRARREVGNAPTIDHVGSPWLQFEGESFDEVVFN